MLTGVQPLFTVKVTVLDVVGEPVTHVALEVISQATLLEPTLNEEVIYT